MQHVPGTRSAFVSRNHLTHGDHRPPRPLHPPRLSRSPRDSTAVATAIATATVTAQVQTPV